MGPLESGSRCDEPNNLAEPLRREGRREDFALADFYRRAAEKEGSKLPSDLSAFAPSDEKWTSATISADPPARRRQPKLP